MSSLLRITGPDQAREIVLDPSGAEVTIGRDASADVQLHDPEKSISRKHVALRLASGSVELRVVSSVNGVDTSRGPVDPGQRVALANGESFTLGGYRVEIVMGAAEPIASRPPAAPIAPDDPFSALLGGLGSTSRSDDPFQRPEFRAPVAVSREVPDPFGQLRGASATAEPFASGPFGGLLGPAATPVGLGGSSGNAAGGNGFGNMDADAAGRQLNDWLGGGSGAASSAGGGGPLDAFLGRSPVVAPRALSPDHVQGFNMPMQFNSPAAPPPMPPLVVPPSAPPASPAASANADVWSNLLEDWGAPAAGSVPSPMAVPAPPARGVKAPAQLPLQPAVPAALQQPSAPLPVARPSPSPPAAPADASPFELDISFEDEAFGSWTGEAPLWSSEAVNMARSAAMPAPPERPNAVSREASPPVASQPDYLEPTLVGGRNESWPAFAKGLGLADSQMIDDKAAERAGAMVRLLVEGLADLLAARADLKRELRAEDRTMLSGRDNNPLKLKLSAAELVDYLFAATAGGGYMPAERAVRESISELRVHEHATIAAARAAVEGALRDFEPARLRKRLVKGKPGFLKMVDNANLWEAYEADYEKQGQHMADWLESIFDRHFMPTYSRETERLKQMSGSAG